jgi:FixJ family two-component response regulator
MGQEPINVFIVDDDRSFGRSLKRLLNARGIAADYIESAAAFLDSVPPGQKGIAIVDVHMPECDGFELMEKMHDMRYRMPVIIITGLTGGFTRDIALQRGAVGLLQKPFSERSLLDLIEAEGMDAI